MAGLGVRALEQDNEEGAAKSVTAPVAPAPVKPVPLEEYNSWGHLGDYVTRTFVSPGNLAVTAATDSYVIRPESKQKAAAFFGLQEKLAQEGHELTLGNTPQDLVNQVSFCVTRVMTQYMLATQEGSSEGGCAPGFKVKDDYQGMQQERMDKLQASSITMMGAFSEEVVQRRYAFQQAQKAGIVLPPELSEYKFKTSGALFDTNKGEVVSTTDTYTGIAGQPVANPLELNLGKVFKDKVASDLNKIDTTTPYPIKYDNTGMPGTPFLEMTVQVSIDDDNFQALMNRLPTWFKNQLTQQVGRELQPLSGTQLRLLARFAPVWVADAQGKKQQKWAINGLWVNDKLPQRDAAIDTTRVPLLSLAIQQAR